MPRTKHIAEVRAEEQRIEAMEAATGSLLAVARVAVGVGAARPPRRLTAALSVSQGGTYLVAALAAFIATDQLLASLLSILGPEIRGAIGMSEGVYGVILAQRVNAAVAVSLQVAFFAHRGRSRRLIVMQAVIATGVGIVVSVFTSSVWPFFLAVGFTSPTAGVVWACHRPMVMDGYVPDVRVRAMSVHQAGVVVGAVVAPILAGALSAWAGFSWRGVLLVAGAVTLITAALGGRLTDPRPGRHDTDAAREAVRAELGATAPDTDAIRLKFWETLRRLWLVPTLRRLLGAWAVIGVVLTPLPAYMSFYLWDHWRMTLGGRSLFFGAAWAFAVPALAWFAPRADARFVADPAALLRAAGAVLGVVAVALALTGTIGLLPAAFIGFAIVLAATAVLVPALTVATLSIVDSKVRAAAGALIATFLVGVGGQGGAAILGGLDRRYGAGHAIALLALPAAAGALLVRRAATTIDEDLDHMLAQVIEDEEVGSLRARGERLPMLACRHIDFSYGQMQVLFDVNFTVDDGEIVALLGTNGAGKSTLLRVIAGLGLPSRGSVRLRGTDITYVDAERRVELGISQVPGGRAIFPPMTVVENLRLLGYTHGRNRRAVDRGIDASFEAFPRLAERRHQLASTLSGGEQQMLGLATAFIVRPQLLLIDELSLGLAPKVIGELLEMVRAINAAGTAIVLVEQSVNIALSIVQHAYFMEKGEIRFDGAANELMGRPDLLRSVFLRGASQALSGTESHSR